MTGLGLGLGLGLGPVFSVYKRNKVTTYIIRVFSAPSQQSPARSHTASEFGGCPGEGYLVPVWEESVSTKKEKQLIHCNNNNINNINLDQNRIRKSKNHQALWAII